MKISAILVVGAIFAVVGIIAFAVIATQQTFPVFKYSTQSDHFVSVSQNIGAKDSEFMWDSNGLNLIGQAFALFAAAAGTLVILTFNQKRNEEQ